jgi:hypothetical protein
MHKLTQKASHLLKKARHSGKCFGNLGKPPDED